MKYTSAPDFPSPGVSEGRASAIIDSALKSADSWLGAHRSTYLIAAAVLCFVTFTGYSHAKVPWVDEVLQMTIARLDSPARIWDALMAGIQVDPPVLHTAQHYIIRVLGDTPFIYRLPAIAGFTLMCVCVTLLLWKYVPPFYAAAAFYLPYATVLRSRAMDARPYGLMFGFAALTLLCWDNIRGSRAPGRWRAAFTLSLAATLSTHFYSIYILLPLAAGELAWWVFRKRPDWWTAVCFALALIPYGIWLPILLSASKRFMSGYFYKVTFQNLYDFYSFAFATLPFAGLFLLLAAAGFVAGRTQVRSDASPQTLGEHYRVLLVASAAFMLLPVIGYLAGVLATGFFVPYYHMLTVFGVAIGLPLVLAAVANRSQIVAACLFLAVGGHGLFVTARGLSGYLRREQPYPTLAELHTVTGDPSADVVIASPTAFLPFYETARSQPGINNLVYLADPAKALNILGTNTADIVKLELRSRTNARIEMFDAYLAAHPRFFLAVLGPAGVIEWQYTYLQRDPNIRLRWRGKAGDFDVYEVNLDRGQ